MYIYAFGSLCRGEIDYFSDLDVLTIIETENEKKLSIDTDAFSVYKVARILELWEEGNPFAWHLFSESRILFSTSGKNLFESLGPPNFYKNCYNDLEKFSDLYYETLHSMKESRPSKVFDLSMIFLAVRNFATCYSLGNLKEMNFSRSSAKSLSKNELKISKKAYSTLERARILSTRGKGEQISSEDFETVISELEIISNWFECIKLEVKNGRV